LNKLLDHLEEWLIASFMGLATIIVFVSVIHRYASGAPIPVLQDFLISINLSWTQELCIYLFIWMAKFGAAYGVRIGIHVGVDVLINRLSKPCYKNFVIFGLLAGALFTGTIGLLGAHFVLQMYDTGQTSADLELPMWIVYLAIPLGSSLMCFRFLQVAWAFITTGHLPKHDPARVKGVVEEFEDHASKTVGAPR